MRRFILSKLQEWKSETNRKVLILRGARQVGKTYIVRELAKCRACTGFWKKKGSLGDQIIVGEFFCLRQDQGYSALCSIEYLNPN